MRAGVNRRSGAKKDGTMERELIVSRELDRESVSDLLRQASLVIHSEDLFDGGTLVLIKHRQDWYRLTITRQGKLILTK